MILKLSAPHRLNPRVPAESRQPVVDVLPTFAC